MRRGRSARDLRVGESAEWGLTLAPALLDAAARVAGSASSGDAPSGVLLAVAGTVLRRDLPGPGTVVESMSIERVGRLRAEETIWAEATVEAVDTERDRATLALRWTNQRGEAVARGEAVVKPPASVGLDVRPA